MGFEDFADGNALSASSLDNLMAQSNILCTSSTRPSAPAEGMEIYETDTDRKLIYSGSAWVRQPIGSSPTGARTGIKLRRASTQAVATATDTAISWDTEDRDSDSYIGVTSSTATIPTGLNGIYVMTAGVLWAADPTTSGAAMLQLNAGGRTWRYSTTALNAQAVRQSVFAVDELAVADTITVEVRQATGSSLNIATAWLQAYRIAG